MIDMDKLDDLGRLYRLFIMVPSGVPCLKKALRESIIRRGKEINATGLSAETDDPPLDDEVETNDNGKGKGKARPPNAAAQTLSLALKWVQDVLDLKDKLDKIWTGSFQSDRELESGLNEVCLRSPTTHVMLTLV